MPTKRRARTSGARPLVTGSRRATRAWAAASSASPSICSPASPAVPSSTHLRRCAPRSEGDRNRVDRIVGQGDRRLTRGPADGFVDAGADAELLLDLLLDLVGKVGVVAEERASVLLALPELVALVGVPGAGLADDAVVDSHVDERALAADALAIEDVELRGLERARHLVLDDL